MKAYDEKCEGCKWLVEEWPGEPDKCGHPKAMSACEGCGHYRPIQQYYARDPSGPCGRDALLFEPKETT